MTKKAEFLQKLKNLLEEYDVSISFSVSDWAAMRHMTLNLK